ncbi:MAG: hypothetical protein RLY20_3071 [Verrucomicrobiota bacterium]|jgi:D-sedoheptulose 7-phosphate isomerase
MGHLQAAVAESIRVTQSLLGLGGAVDGASRTIRRCLLGGGKLLVCGNGGSASDATHLATEFLCRFKSDRKPFPAISLTANGELLTAIGNDYSFDDVFARQVNGLAQGGDVLVCFTTSGKSRNVVRAIEEANRIGIESVCFLGRDGGQTKGMATIELLVEAKSTARIQEAHKLLFHAICEALEDGLASA